MRTEHFDFTKPTLIFSIVGIFIPGFTAIGLLGLQMLFSKIGIECSTAWTIIRWITTPAAFILPVLFYIYLTVSKEENFQSLKTKLLIFNFFEYIFIQSSLAFLFTDEQILCYGSGGQNGLEFAFSAWMSIPILIVLSFIYNKTMKHE